MVSGQEDARYTRQETCTEVVAQAEGKMTLIKGNGDGKVIPKNAPRFLFGVTGGTLEGAI